MKVANATLTRIVFIKTPNNKVVVREIDYVPDWEYLKTKNFDISSNSFAAVDNNFSGTLVVKK